VTAPSPARLLDHLRAELGAPALEFAEAPFPLGGGFDTAIRAFRLAGASGGWARPLILRVLGPEHDPARALREEAVQNAVAGLGFPAPRVLAASADPSLLGGPFLVMERLPGRPMLDVQRLGVAAVLARTQLALHALDAGPLLDEMARIGARDAVTFDGMLAQLAARIARHSLDGLGCVVEWLRRSPPPAARPAICHGDLHPQNILMAGGAVSGVVDWPNTVVADPAYDVASTRIILGLVPLGLLAAPITLRGLLAVVRPIALARHLVLYRRERAIGARELGYYEVASALRHLVRAAEQRQAAASGARPLGPLDASSFGERLCARVARLTGVAPTIPAAPRVAAPAGPSR
jgi:aminoglycoside phosphotransferase (APT) family kinase protein